MATYKISISRVDVDPETKARVHSIRARDVGNVYGGYNSPLEEKISTEILVTEISETQWKKIQLEIVKILEQEIDA